MAEWDEKVLLKDSKFAGQLQLMNFNGSWSAILKGVSGNLIPLFKGFTIETEDDLKYLFRKNRIIQSLALIDE